MKDILIVTSKKYDFKSDFDGGSILIGQLISFLPEICSSLDILYLRSQNDKIDQNVDVRNVKIYEPKYSDSNKFIQRILNADDTVEIIEKEHKYYRLIIVTHVSNCFGIENLSEEIQKKILLFPMFTSESYKKCGEIIPEQYITYEKLAIKACKHIITPSKTEYLQLIQKFKAKHNSISIIPRGINTEMFNGRIRIFNGKIFNIIYVAAIRAQKDHMELVKLSKILLKHNVEFRIHLVGGGEKKVYEKFKNAIRVNNIEEKFVFNGILTPKQLSNLMEQCHVNISVSRYETFGRSIYEGLMKGLPTIVYKRITCLWENLTTGKGIIAVDDSAEQLAIEIMKLYEDPEYYRLLSKQAFSYKEEFSEKRMIENLREYIQGIMAMYYE